MKLKYAPLMALAVLTAGCGTTTISTAASAAPPSAAAAASASAPASPDCNSQAVSWRDNGGKTQIDAVSSDITSVEDAKNSLVAAINAGTDLSAPESALQSAAAALQSDAQTAEADLPPECIPGFRSAWSAALTDYSKAAADYENAVSELGSNSYTVADGDVKAANVAENAGNAKFGVAAKDLETFNKG